MESSSSNIYTIKQRTLTTDTRSMLLIVPSCVTHFKKLRLSERRVTSCLCIIQNPKTQSDNFYLQQTPAWNHRTRQNIAECGE